MIPTPFRFFEVKKKKCLADPALCDEAKFDVAPEALDAVDVIFAAGKLVFVMVNASMFITAQEKAVVPEPAIGVNGRSGEAPGP
jgi:hypothetical protein